MPRILDAVDVAVGEFTRLVREPRSFRDSVVPTQDMEILRLRRENAKLRAALVDDGMRL